MGLVSRMRGSWIVVKLDAFEPAWVEFDSSRLTVNSWDWNASEGTLTVTYNGETSAPVLIPVVPSAPGIFTRNQAGFGPGSIQNWESATSVPTNSLIEPAEPGQVAIIWATGLGPIMGDDSDLPPVGNLPVEVEVLVGGQAVSPMYAGRSAEFPAIDQISFVVPSGLEGCRVPVVLMANGSISNYVTMAVSVGGATCSDPTDYSATDLEKVIQNNGASIGIVSLLRGRGSFSTPLGPMPISMDFVTGGFYQRNSDQILAGAGVRENMLQPTSPSLGTCMVSVFPMEDLRLHPDDPVPMLPLDAGPALHVSGGASGPVQAPPVEMAPGMPILGFYFGLVGGGLPPAEILPDYLLDGQYTFNNGDGGEKVGALSASLNLPPLIDWTNQDEISEISRDEDLLVTWTAGDPANEYVQIMGASDNPAFHVTTGFVCAAPADAGSFAVPAAVLSSIIPTPPWTFEGLPPGVLLLGTAPRGNVAAFTATDLDISYFHYASWVLKNVDFK